MATPPTAKAIGDTLDPNDTDFSEVTISQGLADATPTPILLPGESIASFVLALPPESVAAGLVIKDGSDSWPAPVIADMRLTYWATIAPAMRGASVFDGVGLTLPIELTITTTATPPRIKQRTFTMQVAQR